MARFNLDPVAKPRMTQSDKWNERPAVLRYWAFKDDLQRQAGEQGFILPPAFAVTFYLPMPQGWSKIKKFGALGKPHQARPDLDNMVKAVADSLLPENDSTVWAVFARKLWAMEGAIVIEPLDPKQYSEWGEL